MCCCIFSPAVRAARPQVIAVFIERPAIILRFTRVGIAGFAHWPGIGRITRFAIVVTEGIAETIQYFAVFVETPLYSVTVPVRRAPTLST